MQITKSIHGEEIKTSISLLCKDLSLVSQYPLNHPTEGEQSVLQRH